MINARQTSDRYKDNGKRLTMKDVVIVSGVRTAVGDFLGVLKDSTCVELGVIALKSAMEKANIDPKHIEEVVCGNPDMAGAKSNPGRQIAIYAGCPWETVACTINQQCVSSMRAAEIMYQEILLGKVEIGAVVGCSSMSNIPYLLMGARSGLRMGNQQVVDGMYNDGMIDAFYNVLMGVTAENIVDMYSISRVEQDEFALMSHHRACAAINNKTLADEIAPVEVKTKEGTRIVYTDEHPRQGLTMEDLAKLKPVFRKDGTVTAGNSSGINDGAAALVMMSLDKSRELGIKPLARAGQDECTGRGYFPRPSRRHDRRPPACVTDPRDASSRRALWRRCPLRRRRTSHEHDCGSHLILLGHLVKRIPRFQGNLLIRHIIRQW
ncbi:MAG: hypothetical protein H6Q48_1101 [Deltaproteobacteria bacterium]|nr:hypothetical protein [Deltaproteobacteria bacterium]